MINKENFKDLLIALQFEKKENVYSKHFPQGDFYLKVDIEKENIAYPEDKGLIINERQTCNFKANENFVVFECVHRLLEKGYKPEHIELEPKWKSGHGTSGGRADIMVQNQENEPILIIECKTAGREFDKAWKETQMNGGQLLAYADRERTVKFVCLYASDFGENEIYYENKIIVLADIQNLIEQYSDKEIKPLFYKDIKEVKQWFQVWNETYQKEFLATGIFDDDVQPYNIGQQKLQLKDLKYITGREMQGKFDEFADILRKYSVSSKEAAFDKLINLFLCKIVDENQAHYNGKDLEFHWRGNYADDYFSLIDRLQKLYRDGMEEYLGEKITYIDNKKVLDAFGYFRDRNATRDHVLQLFKQQKYFTNSDFGFIDVHNDKLFYENATILLDVVKMWQNFQLNGEQQNQFLGDMFEGFLDKGFKQSEGQFFTPIPICKFILSALPIEEKLNDSEKPPRVIDYACGSGHFMTEYAAQIRPLIEAHNNSLENPDFQLNIKDYYRNIFGVEKEYRLSKVAKMSAFMYGQDEINVIYCDALKKIQQEIKGQIVLVEEDTCDVLIANPPFAVDGFLTTLNQAERENYTLFTKNIDLYTQRNIQCFFLERAKQLLKSDGVAAIIVPSSVLSNNDATHSATREILLKYFDFISIVELGSGTFGKTGTNTVILFLRRKKQDTEPATHLWNRTLDFFDNWKIELSSQSEQYSDLDLVKKYCQHIEIPYEMYQSLLSGKPSDDLLAIEMFLDYRKDFDKQSEIVDLPKKKFFKELSLEQQTAEISKRFLSYLQAIEQQKMYYFFLANSNPQKVLIVKSPSDNKEQKQFLGYEWSSAKGSEGIKYNGGSTVHDIITPMFDPKNRQNKDKISFFIQQNFINYKDEIKVKMQENDQNIAISTEKRAVLNEIPAHLASFMELADLANLLDFRNNDFSKKINLTAKKKNTSDLFTQPSVKLGEVCEIVIGGTPSRANSAFFEGENLWVSIAEMNGQQITNTKEKITDEGVKKSNVKLIPKGTTLLSFKLSIGKTAIAGSDLYTNEAIAGLIPKDKNTISNAYLFHLFSAKTIDLSTSNNAIGQSLNSKYLRDELKIPVPSLDIQQQIVAECEMIDKAIEKAKMEIIQATNTINEIVESIHRKGYTIKKLNDICKMQAGKFVSASDINDKEGTNSYPCYGGNGLRGYTKTFNYDGQYSLIGRQGALCGNLHKSVNGKFHATEHAVVVTPNLDIDNNWLFYQLKSLNLNQYATGTAQPGLSVQTILMVTTPVPPLSEQEKIVIEIEKIELQITQNQVVINNSMAQRQAIMKKYL